MKFSNFLFPQSTPENDGRVIDEVMDEAILCDQLGMEMLWLAEHHFDGNCSYVDPVAFAAALAVATKKNQNRVGRCTNVVTSSNPHGRTNGVNR